MFDSGTFSYDKNHPDLNKLCKEALLSDLESHLQNKHLILLEWDFEQDFFEQDLGRIAKTHGAQFIVVHLFADIKTRLSRALTRLRRQERHHVHIGPFAKVKKLIGLALPHKWVPAPRDKAPLNLPGLMIRQQMDDFSENDLEKLSSNIFRVLDGK